MTHDWFVVRDSKELGPFTAQQLKQMAATGMVQPDDKVRRDDMKAATKASKIKGLFATVAPAKLLSPPAGTEVTSPPADQKGVTSKKRPITLAMVGGVCLFLCCGGCGLLAMVGEWMRDTTSSQLAEADGLWDKGDKAGAVGKYRDILGFRVAYLKEEDRSRVYGRVIDAEFEAGHADEGKRLIDKAATAGTVPQVTHSVAKSLVAKVEAAKAAKKEKERLADLAPAERLKEAKWGDMVSAGSLYRLFDSNEVAADEKYKGKTIMVEGAVESVQKGSFGSVLLYLADNSGNRAVRCALSGSSDDLAKVRASSWVRVEGNCDGKANSGIVEISGCIFVLVNR